MGQRKRVEWDLGKPGKAGEIRLCISAKRCGVSQTKGMRKGQRWRGSERGRRECAGLGSGAREETGAWILNESIIVGFTIFTSGSNNE